MSSIIALVIGIVLLLWAHKRSFDRTNEHGVEVYNSFLGMLGARAVNILIGLVGAVCAIGGVIVLVYNWA